MPPEWPPKNLDTKPSGPDPDAVRLALAEIDEAESDLRSGRIRSETRDYLFARQALVLAAAARAWLAQQDEEAKRKARESQAYLRKMSDSVGYGPDFT